MKKNQLQGALAAIIGVAITAGTISTSQAETRLPEMKPSTMSLPSTPSLPGSMAKPTQSPLMTVPSSQNGDTIVDLAMQSKQFKTLVKAVQAAELAEALSSKGPFTLFAPNDKAFAKLPKGTLAKLLKPKNKGELQKVLKYHVLSGAVMSQDIKPGNAKTIEGSSVKFRIKGQSIRVNNAKVIKTNVQASNGIVHTIDTVLIPPDLQLK